MLEIKTIIEAVKDAPQFDRAVNEALADGWALVRRDVIPSGVLQDSPRLLYAELERELVLEEEDESDKDAFASWRLTRDPDHPYACSVCGFKAPPEWFMGDEFPEECPNCERFTRRAK